MSDDQKATSGAATDSSGSGNQPSETVPEVIGKLKKEKENLAKLVNQMRGELDSIKKGAEESQVKELQSKEEYKRLYEMERKKAEELSLNVKGLQSKITEGTINSNLRSELLKLGCEPQHIDTALTLADRKMVVIDPDTGTIVGADDCAKAFYDKFNALGFFKKASGGINHNAPKHNKAQTDLATMTLNEKKAYLKSVMGQ